MHISELIQLINDPKNEFSMDFVKSTGELIHIDRCVCTSVHSSGLTLNIMCLPSNQVRKIVRTSILKVNNKPLYL